MCEHTNLRKNFLALRIEPSSALIVVIARTNSWQTRRQPDCFFFPLSFGYGEPTVTANSATPRTSIPIIRLQRHSFQRARHCESLPLGMESLWTDRIVWPSTTTNTRGDGGSTPLVKWEMGKVATTCSCRRRYAARDRRHRARSLSGALLPSPPEDSIASHSMGLERFGDGDSTRTARLEFNPVQLWHPCETHRCSRNCISNRARPSPRPSR